MTKQAFIGVADKARDLIQELRFVQRIDPSRAGEIDHLVENLEAVAAELEVEEERAAAAEPADEAV